MRQQEEKGLPFSERNFRATIDALAANLCVVDGTGNIQFVNRSWREFAESNGAVPDKVSENINYLEICDSAVGTDADFARQFARGIRAVLSGMQDEFLLEYPCHAPGEKRWFSGRVTRFSDGGAIHAVIAHKNITARRQAQEMLHEQESFQRLLIKLSSGLINVPLKEIDAVINDMLAALGKYVQMDRVYIFKHRPAHRISTNTHEWCAEGLLPEIDHLQAVPLDLLADVMVLHRKGDFFYIPCIDEMSKDHPLRTHFKHQEVQSVVSFPLISEGLCIGFVGFDAVKNIKPITDMNVTLLKIVAEVISNIMTRQRKEEAFIRTQTELKIIYDNVPVMICLLDEDRRVLYANRAFTSFVGVSEDELPEGRACGVFGCINALDDPRGCGFGYDCPDCTLLSAVNDTFRTGNGHHTIEKCMTRELDGNRQDITLLGSTSLISTAEDKSLLLCLTDITDRKRSEENLRESKERFKIAGQAAYDLIYEWNVADDTLEWFADIDGLLGYPPGSISRNINAWLDLIHPEDRTRLKDAVAVHRSSIKPINYEYRIKLRNGTYRYLQDRGIPLLDKKGLPYRWIGACADITERKEAEVALRESEEKFRSAFRTSPDSINLNRVKDGVYIDINEGFTQIMGFSREEIIGRSSLEFDIWNDPKDRERLVARLKKYGVVENMEAEFRSKGGQIKTGLMSARIVNIGNEDVILSITRDISDIKQNEKDTQTLVETTIGKTGQELFDVAAAKLCEWLNCECAIVGEIIQKDTVRALSMVLDGKPVYDYTYSLKGSPCDETIRKCFCIYPEQVSVLFPDDSDLIQMGAQGYVGVVLKGKDNEIIGVLCGISRGKLEIKKNTTSIMNIIGSRVSSEIIRLQAEKEKTKLEMQIQQSQKMEAIGTLAGGIAHDFNNILFPIVGHAEILLDDIPEDGPIRSSLKEIHISALRARDLVQQILSFSRQGTTELKLMKMQPIIREALKLIRSTIPTTISIRQNLQSGCGAVKADPTQIHQIIMNLTTNAYHAMEENGGDLAVTLKEITLAQKDLFHPDMSPGAYARLTVSDTGTGIDRDIVNRIFEPFFTTKKKGKGTGMGLSMVHGIVKRMNGAVQVYSEPGRGTEIHVYLPLAESISEHQEPHIAEAITGGPERILIVDDESAVIALEKQMLERLGYHIVFRTSSIEALEAFRARPDQFDLVITDMSMPGLPGDKLAVELSRIRPDIPILLCTGFSERMTDERIKSLGIRGLLMKPIVMKDLACKIREVLDK